MKRPAPPHGPWPPGPRHRDRTLPGRRERKRLNLAPAWARAGAAVVLVAAGLAAIGQPICAHASPQVRNADPARFRPSGAGLPFNPGRYRDFDDYVRQTRERLERHKVYMDPGRKATELAAATPFERTPAEGCAPAPDGRAARGILLLHGLADMPLAMRDLADAFAARCFLVRAMLLPGHGSRAGDLLDVTRGDWLAAVRFGVATLKADAGAVFAGGFSLGGLLEQRHVAAPVFMALGTGDPVIGAPAARAYFETRFSHPGSRLVVYRPDPREGPDSADARIRYVNSFLPAQRIAGFSHLSIHIAPDNAHYGTLGDYRNCGQGSGESAEAVARCLAAAHPWRGEMFGDGRAAAPGGEPLARLTYNPRFAELLDSIDGFIAANKF